MPTPGKSPPGLGQRACLERALVELRLLAHRYVRSVGRSERGPTRRGAPPAVDAHTGGRWRRHQAALLPNREHRARSAAPPRGEAPTHRRRGSRVEAQHARGTYPMPGLNCWRPRLVVGSRTSFRGVVDTARAGVGLVSDNARAGHFLSLHRSASRLTSGWAWVNSRHVHARPSRGASLPFRYAFSRRARRNLGFTRRG